MHRSINTGLVVGALLLASACTPSPPGPPVRVSFDDYGFSLAHPGGWLVVAGEVQSRHGTHFEVKVISLEMAQRDFLAGLPQTITPELLNWTKFRFNVVGEGVEGSDTIGGVPAMTMRYDARVRAGAEVTTVRYWALRRADLLYLFRTVFPPGRLEPDGPLVDAMLHSIEFSAAPPGQPVTIQSGSETPPASPPADPGSSTPGK